MMNRTLVHSVVVFACWTVAIAGTDTQSGRTDPNQKEWLQLFNSRDINDWSIKFAHHDLGENVNDMFRVENGLLHGDELVRHMIDGRTVLEYAKPQIGGGSASPTDPTMKVDGTPLTRGYIALQAETAPANFRKVELLNLEGCVDPNARNFKTYFVQSAPSTCRY